MIFVGNKVPHTCTFWLCFLSITLFPLVSDEKSITEDQSVGQLGSFEDEARVASPTGQ